MGDIINIGKSFDELSEKEQEEFIDKFFDEKSEEEQVAILMKALNNLQFSGSVNMQDIISDLVKYFKIILILACCSAFYGINTILNYVITTVWMLIALYLIKKDDFWTLFIPLSIFENTIIGEDILNDFAFINTDIPNKLDEMVKEIGNAAAITDAFYFENGSSVSDINHAYEEIKNDVEMLKTGLNELKEGFKTAIANVNAELASNFGYWTASKPRVAGRTVEEIPATEE